MHSSEYVTSNGHNFFFTVFLHCRYTSNWFTVSCIHWLLCLVFVNLYGYLHTVYGLMVLVTVYLWLAGVFVELGCHDDHSLYKMYKINVVF